jgi:hypothetical protein
MPEEKKSPSDTLGPELEEDFASLYANNVSYEASVWDLKLIFGQLDLKTVEKPQGQPTVDYHTAITIPWSTVKTMVYYLRVNLAGHEGETGQIKLPERVMPARPNDPEEDPKQKAAFDAMRRIWDEEFGKAGH